MTIETLTDKPVQVISYFNVLRGLIVAVHIERQLVLIRGKDLFGDMVAWAPINFVEEIAP